MATYDLNTEFTHCHLRPNTSDKVVTGAYDVNTWYIDADYGYIFTEDTPTLTRYKNGALTTYKYVLKTSAWLTDANKGYRLELTLGEANMPPFTLSATAVRDESVPIRTLNITNNVGGVASYEQKSSSSICFDLKKI